MGKRNTNKMMIRKDTRGSHVLKFAPVGAEASIQDSRILIWFDVLINQEG